MMWNHIKIQSIDKGKHSKPVAYRTDPKLHQELFTTHSPFVDKIKEKKFTYLQKEYGDVKRFHFLSSFIYSVTLFPPSFLYLYVPLIRVNKKMRYRIWAEGGCAGGLGASLRCLIQKAPRVQFPEACGSRDQGEKQNISIYNPSPPSKTLPLSHVTLNSESTLQSPIKLRSYVLYTQDSGNSHQDPSFVINTRYRNN